MALLLPISVRKFFAESSECLSKLTLWQAGASPCPTTICIISHILLKLMSLKP